MQGLDPRIPFGIQAVTAMVEKRISGPQQTQHPSKYCYLFILT